MKAFLMDDENTVYAADSIEDAIKQYQEEYALDDEDFDKELVFEISDDTLDKLIDEYDEDEKPTGRKTTMRTWLNEAKKTGWLCGGHG